MQDKCVDVLKNLRVLRCNTGGMAKRMPPEVLEYLQEIGKQYGKLGGKTAAKNLTAAERSARAKKGSLAAAKKRTAERLARERQAAKRK